MPHTNAVQSKPQVGKKSKRPEPLSPAATRIVQAALRDDIQVSDLAAMANTDPAFALRLLSYVNNPVLGLGRRVDSIAQAANLLGIRGIRSIALSLVITHLAKDTEGIEPVLANCLRRAVTARELARRSRQCDADIAFTVGLFLDAGLLVAAKDDPRSALVAATSPACFRLVREQALGLMMHPDLGAEIARDHFLPEEFVEAILRHHGLVCPASPVAKVAWVAEQVAAVFEGGYYVPAQQPAAEALSSLGLAPENLQDLLATIPQAVVELSTVFDRYVGPQLEIEALRARAEESIVALTEQYESLVATLEKVIRQKDRLSSELRDTVGRVAELQTMDPLTGLCNRASLEAALERDLARASRDRSPLSLLLIDIDDFERVNDAYGHRKGDAVLAMVGKILLSTLRTGDVVGRMQGDEFAIVLPSTDRSGAEVVAARLCALLPQHAVTTPAAPISVTCSIGVACLSGAPSPEAKDELLAAGHRLLAAAKSRGGNGIAATV